jgi:PAS domain S-box-containing protein
MDGLAVILVAVIAASAGAGVTYWVMRRRIAALRTGLEKVAQGDLSYRLPAEATDPDHLNALFNRMVEQLNSRLTLQKNEATNQAILDSMPDLLFRFDKDGIFLDYRNPRDSTLLVKPEDFLGRSVFDVLSRDLAEKTLQTIRGVLESGRTGGFDYQLVVNGSPRNYETRHMLVGKGEVLALVRDVTQRKQQEELLQASLEQEKQLSDLKSDFMILMNHEFRTPLAIILTSSDLLERYTDRLTDEQREKHFGLIRTQVSHLARVLDDILTISRAETVGLKLETMPVDLENMCRGVIEDLKPALDNHPLTFSVPERCKVALFDPRLIQQAVTNLLSNAIKFSSPDSPIEFDLICGGNEALIRIQDHGIGIPPEDREHLFNVFYRAQNVDERPGVGLGLALVKHAAHLHGGSITVESTVDVGTTFTLKLPLVEDETRRPNKTVMSYE